MGGQAEIPCPPSLLAFTNYFLFWGTWSWILDRGIDWGAGSRMHPLPSRLWPPQFSHENVSLLPTNCFYFTYFCLLVFLFSVFFFYFLFTPSDVHCLPMAMHSGITPVEFWGPIWVAWDGTQFGHLQNKCPPSLLYSLSWPQTFLI